MALGKGGVVSGSAGPGVTGLAGVVGAAGVGGLTGVLGLAGVVCGVIAVTTLSTAPSKRPASQSPPGITSVPPPLREVLSASQASREFLLAPQTVSSGVEGVSQAPPGFPSAPQDFSTCM